jgi:hypothetical protein
MRRRRQSVSRPAPEVGTALAVSKWLWPEFQRVGGGTFLRSTAPHKDWHPTSDLLDQEAFSNHTHVFDVFAHRAYFKRAPWFDQAHPDFAAACHLGEIMCETWAAKLRRDFPDEDYAVICSRDDNPIVRFHKIREGAETWIDPGDCPPGTVLLIHSRDGRRLGAIHAPQASSKKRRRPSRRPFRVG